MSPNSARAVQVLPAAPQASSDAQMLELWLNQYRPGPAVATNTSKSYSADIRLFLAFVGKPMRRLTISDIQQFAASFGDGCSDATRSRRLSTVKSLVGFAHRVGYIPYDIGAPIRLPAIKDTLSARILTEWDVQQLIGLERRPRNTAILRLIYSAGLRISEVCALCWRDFVARDDAGQITVFGKGGKTRIILLPSPIWNRVVALRGESGPDDPVFRSATGGHLHRSRVHRIVKIAARRARLSSKVSAHYLRHSHCSHALDRGAPVHVVQATLGHASLATTTRYTHVRPGDSSARYLVA